VNDPSCRWLLADVGGTNCRFAVAADDGEITAATHFPTAASDGPAQAIHRAIGEATRPRPLGIALAVAGPVQSDRVDMTNATWSFSISALARTIGVPVLVTNDFVAASYALTHVAPRDLPLVGPSPPLSGHRDLGTRVVLGPGTGLGVGIVAPVRGGWTAVPSEAGHMTAAARDADEDELIAFARREHAHVSWERLISGSGLELVHRWVTQRLGLDPATRDAASIASAPDDPGCRDSRRRFALLLGSFAADVALAARASGGVYLTGGVLEGLGTRFDAQAFRSRFETSGRSSALLAQIATARIADPLAPFRGLASAIESAAHGDTPSGCRFVEA